MNNTFASNVADLIIFDYMKAERMKYGAIIFGFLAPMSNSSTTRIS